MKIQSNATKKPRDNFEDVDQRAVFRNFMAGPDEVVTLSFRHASGKWIRLKMSEKEAKILAGRLVNAAT